MTKHLRAIAVLAALVMAVPAFVAAQSFSGVVAGVVKDDSGGVLPGATVQLIGKTGTRDAVTDAQGGYRFNAVDPGVYTVVVSMAGFQSQRRENLEVSVGKQSTIDASLKVKGQTDSIDVVGEAPVVDVTSSSTQNNLSQDLLYNMPIRQGNTATNLLNFAPGINSQSAFGGDGSSANGLLIDGVDTRDPSGGTAWTFFNFNIVEEVEIVGIGAPAEYGSFTGAVVNTITKSGGNRYAGLFDFTYTKGSLASKNVGADVTKINPALGESAKTNKFTDFTTQFSGPLIKDKLFFFASAQRYHLNQDPAGPRTVNDEVSPRVNVKLNYQPSASNNFMAHVQYDAYNIIGRAGVSALVATDDLTNQEDAPEWVWIGQWRHIFGSKTFSEVKYTGWTGFYDLNPKVKAPQHFDGETSLYSVSQGWSYYADRGRNQVNASISHFAEGFGKHDLKFGIEVERSKTRDRYSHTNNTYYYDYGGQPYYAYGYGYDLNGRNKKLAGYAQDAWHVNDRLTLNLGVRLDHVGGGAPGGDTLYSNTSIAPRLGFAFDPKGDTKTVIKGSYSQYYEGIFNDIYKQATAGYQDSISWDMAGCPAYGPQGPTATYNCPLSRRDEVNRVKAPIAKIDPDIKHPRVDEFSFGFERALRNNVRLAVTGIMRDNKNFIGQVLPSARWTRQTGTSPAPNGKNLVHPATPYTYYRWANRSASAGDVYITNPDGFQYLDPAGNVLGTVDAYRKYKGAMFVLTKNYSNRWRAQLSYVWSQTKGTVNNSSEGTYGVSSFYASPTMSLVNADGNLSNDRTHEIKAMVGVQIPKVEVAINAYFRSISGGTYAPYVQLSGSTTNYSTTGYYFASSAGRRPSLEPRGSRRLDTLNILDLRLEKIFTIKGDHRLSVYSDITNALNVDTVTSVFNNVGGTGVFNPPPAALGSTTSVPFGGPAAITPPRQIQVGARWSF
ncbi:MAG: TonB-dependent receptor [Vicinamibacteria bacterium]|nr:TonB-dependent receptor [Vicinamibacteria bacterium]